MCKCVHVLCRFVNYGSGAKRFPLQEVLQYALEFAQSKPDGIDSPPMGSGGGDNTEYIPIQDVEMESPKSQARSVTCHSHVTWYYDVTVNMSTFGEISDFFHVLFLLKKILSAFALILTGNTVHHFLEILSFSHSLFFMYETSF